MLDAFRLDVRQLILCKEAKSAKVSQLSPPCPKRLILASKNGAVFCASQ